ncbi:CRISPR-associated helicase Cas3' [Streptomyces sp. NPDC057638]|uniref:CRISPR-associated helicase Cas3' n=1 Tax=Streptomyces sp. NPDC057638 TaxID=3346190 RepID=UPI0036B735E3
MGLRERCERFGEGVLGALGALWGKSRERAGGRTSLLMCHLLDTAAVAEILWDRFLAPATRSALDELAGGAGRGRSFFVWLCGLHDVGKATPAHQRLWPEGAEVVRAVGLTWSEGLVAGARGVAWRHDKAGGVLVREVLGAAGWDVRHTDWVWPLVAGHHGAFPTLGNLQEPRKARGHLRGREAWREVQTAVFEVFSEELGFVGLSEAEPAEVPPRALQLHLSGLMVMADWIASDERHFPGLDDLDSIGLEVSRVRAADAWEALRLRGGWQRLALPGPGAFEERFGCAPRPSQRQVVEVAHRMAAPGIMVVEAPMGEGKTEAAQLAAEVLAARFGADGVFVGMPSQATSDPMFSRTRRWLSAIGAGDLASRVVLLHGKREFTTEWKELTEGTEGAEGTGGADGMSGDVWGGVDEYGLGDDPFGMEPSGCGAAERQGPSEWFLGAKRGLLAPFVVGTVDQLLYAATRTRHVMLRAAGLAGKVVVLDEVHACDVYMSQFLKEALYWLGEARVPVVLLSATLPPAQRESLVAAYLAGAASREEFAVRLPAAPGYPNVTAAWLDTGGEPGFLTVAASAWRPDRDVRVETVVEEVPRPGMSREERTRLQRGADATVAELLERELADGGTALVIRNSVGRAQSLYEELRGRFGARSLRLLHARFTVADRADLTAECLRLLGPDTPRSPGERLVVVATQLAEQSFDVDADLLITDLAPMDLLLQRMGRLHRHQGTCRPGRLGEPRVFITGFDQREGREPAFIGASEFIYGRHLLLRTAAALPPSGGTWPLPGQVPALVEAVYGADPELLPEEWRAAGEEARGEQEESDRARADRARDFLLASYGEHERPTLAGLHFAASTGSRERELRAAVRDGDESAEVVLVVRDEEGGSYRTLVGRALSVNGDVAPELLSEVLGATVRLPASFTPDALALSPLPGWHGHAWLSRSHALVLDASHRARLGEARVRYDRTLGFLVESAEG